LEKQEAEKIGGKEAADGGEGGRVVDEHRNERQGCLIFDDRITFRGGALFRDLDSVKNSFAKRTIQGGREVLEREERGL